MSLNYPIPPIKCEEVTYNVVLIAQGRKKVDVTFDGSGNVVEEEITAAPAPKKK